jgi:hypothetical protein
MSKFSKIVTAAKYQISDSASYQWKSFGENARFLDFTSSNEKIDMSIVFDTSNRTVFYVNLNIRDKYYLWIHPKFKDDYFKECKKKNTDPSLFCDEYPFIIIKKFNKVIKLISKNF